MISRRSLLCAAILSPFMPSAAPAEARILEFVDLAAQPDLTATTFVEVIGDAKFVRGLWIERAGWSFTGHIAPTPDEVIAKLTEGWSK